METFFLRPPLMLAGPPAPLLCTSLAEIQEVVLGAEEEVQGPSRPPPSTRWSDAGQMLVRCWSDAGQMLVRC